MKNIHILPTDKPSKLAGSEYITNEQGIDKRAFKLKLWGKIIPNKDLRDVGYIPQHIYITNDESLKKGKEDLGSYYLDWKGNITKKQNSDWQITFLNDFKKKIILTTNQDLIKEGVQAIDDEFLEWFVKNLSCEEVEVETDIKWKSTVYDQPDIEDGYIYKLIIPKEEPKLQCKDCNDSLTDCTCIEDTINMKQETLEEASWKFNPLKKLDGEFLRHAFKEGVKSDAAREYWYKIFKSE